MVWQAGLEPAVAPLQRGHPASQKNMRGAAMGAVRMRIELISKDRQSRMLAITPTNRGVVPENRTLPA
jgi:hypothetical protein